MSWLSELFTPENVIGMGSMAGQGMLNFYQQQQANKQNYRIHKENLAWSRESQLLAQQYNTQMWQMNNQWNSPANQMALLRGAGLNPNLAYGHAFGSASAPQINSQTASEGSPMQAPQMSGLENIWSSLLQDKQVDQQQQQIDQQKKLIDSEVGLNRANSFKTLIEAGVYTSKEARDKEMHSQMMTNMKQEYTNLVQQNKLLIAQTDGQTEATRAQRFLNDINDSTKQSQIQHILNQLDLDQKTLDYYDNLIAVGLSTIGLNEAKKQQLIDMHEYFKLTKDDLVLAVNAANKLSAYMSNDELATQIFVNGYMGFNPVAFLDDVEGLGINTAIFNHYGNLTEDGQKWMQQALNNKKHRGSIYNKPEGNNMQAALTTIMFAFLMRGGFKTKGIQPIGY